MKYIKANEILPPTLLEELQNYIEGGYLYIPTKKINKKHWGELNGCRKILEQRNTMIKNEYFEGKSIEALADKYYLSVHSIKKIIYQK